MKIFYTTKWTNLFRGDQRNAIETFKIGNDKKFISYSFIKRPINVLSFASILENTYFDIMSPYGYGGIFLSPEAENDEKMIDEFKNKFSDYCLKGNIVAEFVRFDPIRANHIHFSDWYDLMQVNDNVYIDLTCSKEKVFEDIEKRHRYSIRKGEQAGIKIELDKNFFYLADFERLYQTTMSRNKAESFYFFDSNFFQNLIDSFKENILLYVAKFNDKIIAAALFIIDEDSVYYFLAGSDCNYFKFSPNHLLLYKVIEWAKDNDKKHFNFGGGLTKNDSLYAFKSGFSSKSLPYYIGKNIHNAEIYNKLVKMSGVKSDEVFFPLYRFNKL